MLTMVIPGRCLSLFSRFATIHLYQYCNWLGLGDGAAREEDAGGDPKFQQHESQVRLPAHGKAGRPVSAIPSLDEVSLRGYDPELLGKRGGF